MNGRNKLLLALLLLQIGVGAFLYWPSDGKGTAASTPLLQGLDAKKITELIMTDEQKKTLTLKKGEKGWVIPAAENFPADQAKVESFLGKLSGLTSERLITKTKGSHKRLKVAPDDYSRQIEIKTSAEGAPVRLFLGTSPNYKTIHVRVDGQNEVYLAKELYAWEAGVQPASWWNSRLVTMAKADVVKVLVTTPQANFSASKDKDGKWAATTPETALDETALGGLLDSITALSMTKSLGTQAKAEFLIDQPAAVFTLASADHEFTLTVGQALKENDAEVHVVKASDSPFYVQAPGHLLKEVLAKRLEDFVKKPEVPSAEGQEQEALPAPGEQQEPPVQGEQGELSPLAR